MEASKQFHRLRLLGANYKLPYSSLKKSDHFKMKIDRRKENQSQYYYQENQSKTSIGNTPRIIKKWKYSKNYKEM